MERCCLLHERYWQSSGASFLTNIEDSLDWTRFSESLRTNCILVAAGCSQRVDQKLAVSPRKEVVLKSLTEGSFISIIGGLVEDAFW